MGSKLIGTQTDPQFGWVTADPTSSQGYDPIGKAKSLYKTMYGVDPMFSGTTVPKMTRVEQDLKRMYPNTNYPSYSNISQYDAYNNLMEWYYAASNPDVQADPTTKSMLDYYAKALSSTNTPSRITEMSMRYDPKYQMRGLFGGRPAKSDLQEALDPKYGRIGNNYGIETPWGLVYNQDPRVNLGKAYMDISDTPFANTTPEQRAKAIRKIAEAGMIYSPELEDVFKRQGVASPKNAAEQIAPLEYASPEFKGFTNYLRRQGGMPNDYYDFKGPYYREGADYLSQFDPNVYGAPTLKRYFEGPNANIRSNEGGPWTAKRDAQNYSWSKGGEFLVDEAFNYYKSKSTPGTMGSQWSPVAGNPNVQQGFFNNQQSFFTPYEYAVKGYADPTTMKTNIANIDPNIWAQQGNLQNLNGNWGFVTQNNPFMGLNNPNLQLDPETVTAKLTWDSGGGFLGGLLGSLPGLVAGAFIPGSSFVTGAASLSSMFDKSKPSSRNPGPWYQPVVYPKWA